MSDNLLLQAGCTLEEVLALRDQAKAEIMGGAVEVTQWRTGDASATRMRGISAKEMIALCADALAELDPETYGQNIIPHTTRAVFC